MLVFDSFLGTHYLGEEEEKAAIEVIRSKSLFRYDGPDLLRITEKFENNLKKFLDAEYVIACSSGASALKMCCVSLGIGFGDEVIVPSFTFIASAAAVLNCGAIPIFVDVDLSMNIDSEKIEAAITEKTKAIMAVHIQGVPADMKKIMSIAERHNLFVIEDCAQAFGSMIGGRRIGTFGDAAAFSLQSCKVITAGEGGIFVCKNKEQYIKANMYHDNGGYRVGDNYPDWEKSFCSFGENYKISELSSGIANAQLGKFDRIYEKQKRSYDLFMEKIDLNKFSLRTISEDKMFIPVSLCFIFEDVKTNLQFIEEMNRKNVMFEQYCDKVLTKFNTFKNQYSWHKSRFPYNSTSYHLNECRFTEELIDKTAWLAISPLLEEDDIEYICKTINDFDI